MRAAPAASCSRSVACCLPGGSRSCPSGDHTAWGRCRCCRCCCYQALPVAARRCCSRHRCRRRRAAAAAAGGGAAPATPAPGRRGCAGRGCCWRRCCIRAAPRLLPLHRIRRCCCTRALPPPPARRRGAALPAKPTFLGVAAASRAAGFRLCPSVIWCRGVPVSGPWRRQVGLSETLTLQRAGRQGPERPGVARDRNSHSFSLQPIKAVLPAPDRPTNIGVLSLRPHTLKAMASLNRNMRPAAQRSPLGAARPSARFARRVVTVRAATVSRAGQGVRWRGARGARSGWRRARL